MDKEAQKAKRKEAYQKAKEKRDRDPEYLALKEKANAARKAQYQEYKNKLKAEKLQEKKLRQAERDEELAKISGLFGQLRLLKFDDKVP